MKIAVARSLVCGALLTLVQCRAADEAPPQPQKVVVSSPYDRVDIAPLMKGVVGAFVLLDAKRNRYFRYNEKRAATRFSPCSTFKIPNTLIGLETGVAKSPETTISWDRAMYPKEPFWDEVLKPNGIDWARDHTLRSAFRNSVVWYYKELAKQIGASRMRHYLAQFDYGNQDITSGIDRFWLGASLEISAEEQVVFLKKLIHNELGLSKSIEESAFEVFETERGKGYTLFAKTGAYTGGDSPGIGWYVGIVRKSEGDYLFAFNMRSDSFQELMEKRMKITKAILRALGVLPDDSASSELVASRARPPVHRLEDPEGWHVLKGCGC